MNLPNNRDYLLSRLLFHAANPGIACGNEVLTLSTANATPLATIPTGARYAILQVIETTTFGSTNVISYLMDGASPTSTTGLVRGDHEAFDIYGMENLVRFKAIRLSANAHTIRVQYFK